MGCSLLNESGMSLDMLCNLFCLYEIIWSIGLGNYSEYRLLLHYKLIENIQVSIRAYFHIGNATKALSKYLLFNLIWTVYYFVLKRYQ